MFKGLIQEITKQKIEKKRLHEHSRYYYKRRDKQMLLIHNAPKIITSDENDKTSIKTDYSIIIKDDKIVDVVPSKKIVDFDQFDMIYDAGKRGGVVITPGLINTHAHPPMYLMRSIMDLHEGEDLEEVLSLMPKWESVMTDEEYAVATIGDITEQQKFGITTTLSHYGIFYPIEYAAKITRHNIVNALSAVSNTHPNNSPKMVAELLKKKESFFSIPAIALHYLYKASDDVLKEVAQIIKENNILFTCHLAESKFVESITVEKHGLREIERLEKFGLLGEKTILSHSIHLTDDEIKRIIKAKAGISHLPTSNVIHKSGTFPFWKFIDNNGFPYLSLGTDGVVSKPRLDILSEAYQTRMTHMFKRKVKLTSLFKMMTANGARVLGMSDRGKILPGFKADLAFWKLKDRGCIPYDENNPITLLSNIITHGGRPVRDLLINGQFVIKDRVFRRIDESNLLDALQKSHMSLRKRVDSNLGNSSMG